MKLKFYISLILFILGINLKSKSIENFINYKISCDITNENEADSFLRSRINDEYLDSIIDVDSAALAVKFIADETNIDESKKNIWENAETYISLIKEGQKYANYIIKDELNKIPGYNWESDYNDWLEQESKNNNKDLRFKKLNELRSNLLESICALQNYFYALAQTHMDHYKGFISGTFSFISPYKDKIKNISDNYLNLILEIVKYKPFNKNKKINPKNLKSKRPRSCYISNRYAYCRKNSHNFKDSIGIDLVDLKTAFNKYNNSFMYKFKHILMGVNEDQFWWKPESAGLGNFKDTINHGKDLLKNKLNRKINPHSESGSKFAKERPVKEIIDLFKKATGKKFKHIKNIYRESLSLNENNKQEKLTNLIQKLEKNYTHLNKRWGHEIILSKEDFITSYLNNPTVNDTIKRYIHYFISTKRLLCQFQKYFNDNESISVILPSKSEFIKAPESNKILLTIIGHKVRLSSEEPIELIKNELNNISCLTKTLDSQLKNTFTKDIYDYLKQVENNIIINNIKLDQKGNRKADNIIVYKDIFEINR